MKLALGLLLSLGLSSSALADAYYVCAAPARGGVSISPYSEALKGNSFVLTLSANYPLVKSLGLAPTQDYELRGVLDNCESNPKAAHASYCDKYSGPFDISVLGLTDGSLTKMHINGMSIKANDTIDTNAWNTRALVNVQIIIDPTQGTSYVAKMVFEVPMPGSAAGQLSQCL